MQLIMCREREELVYGDLCGVFMSNATLERLVLPAKHIPDSQNAATPCKIRNEQANAPS